jgi:TRAP-type C4-dicarboxylate transport system permease small subunit
MNRLRSVTYRLANWFEGVAIVALLFIVVSTCVDVVGAKLFLWPIPGGTEAVYLAQVVALAAAIAYTEIDARHIRVEFFIDKLPKRGRAFLQILISLLGLVLFVLVGWQSYEYGLIIKSASAISPTARIPLYPFPLWIALSCIPICLVFLMKLLNSLAEVMKR